MNRRHALGALLGLAGGGAGGWGGAALGRVRPADDEVVVHRPDVRRFKPHPRNVGPTAFSPDGSRLVTVGDIDKVRVWDAATGREVLSFGYNDESIIAVAYSPDGRRIAIAGVDGWILGRNNRERWRDPAGYAIWVHDAGTGREQAKIKGAIGFMAVAFGADGNTLTTLDREDLLQVWEIAGAREIVAIKGSHSKENHGIAVNRSVSFDAGARRVVLATAEFLTAGPGQPRTEPVFKLWDVDGREFRPVTPRLQLQLDAAGGSCLLSPDGTRIATTYHEFEDEGLAQPRFKRRSVAIVDFDTATVVRRADADADMDLQEYLVAFSPDGRRFLSTRKEGVLRLWDVATGRVVRTIRGPEQTDGPREGDRTIFARAAVFLPRGIRVASGGHHGWNEVDPATNRIIPDPVTGQVLRVDPLQIWDAELDWAR